MLREQALVCQKNWVKTFSLYQKMSSKAKCSVNKTTKVENLRVLRSITDFNTTTSFDIGNSAVRKFSCTESTSSKLCIVSESLGKSENNLSPKNPNRTIKFFPILHDECKRTIIRDELVSSKMTTRQ